MNWDVFQIACLWFALVVMTGAYFGMCRVAETWRKQAAKSHLRLMALYMDLSAIFRGGEGQEGGESDG